MNLSVPPVQEPDQNRRRPARTVVKIALIIPALLVILCVLLAILQVTMGVAIRTVVQNFRIEGIG